MNVAVRTFYANLRLANYMQISFRKKVSGGRYTWGVCTKKATALFYAYKYCRFCVANSHNQV